MISAFEITHISEHKPQTSTSVKSKSFQCVHPKVVLSITTSFSISKSNLSEICHPIVSFTQWTIGRCFHSYISK